MRGPSCCQIWQQGDKKGDRPGRWHIKDMKKGVVTGVHTGSANPDSSEVPAGTGQTD